MLSTKPRIGYPPTIAELWATVDFQDKLGNVFTFVHREYGHGRIGTGISTVQVYVEDGERPTKTERLEDESMIVWPKMKLATNLIIVSTRSDVFLCTWDRRE